MPEVPQPPKPAEKPEDSEPPKRWSFADMARIMTSYLIGLLLVLAFPVGLYHLVPDDSWERILRRWNRWRNPPKEATPSATSRGLALPNPLLVKGARPKNLGGGSVSFVAKNREFRGAMDPKDDPPAYSKPSSSYSGDEGMKFFKTRVIRTQKKWRELWRLMEREGIPKLAGNRMALVVFGGRQPAGTTVRILSARPERGRLTVRYRITTPGERDSRVTHPYHVLIVPATSLRPVFTRVN